MVRVKEGNGGQKERSRGRKEEREGRREGGRKGKKRRSRSHIQALDLPCFPWALDESCNRQGTLVQHLERKVIGVEGDNNDKCMEL
jgi:hypothetical protein